MGQRRIVIDLTEYQAKILRMAVRKLHMVAPAKLRTRLFTQKLNELLEVIEQATADLPDIAPVIPPIPMRREAPRSRPAYMRRNTYGRFSVR